jgi:hypothetical protein
MALVSCMYIYADIRKVYLNLIESIMLLRISKHFLPT